MNEIVTGIGNNSFNPIGDVTRAQLAVMLHRYAGKLVAEPGLGAFRNYRDVPEYAQIAMEWAVENDIIKGRTSLTLVPNGNATRAEVAIIIKRFVE